MAPALEARDLYRFYHAGDDETLALRGVSFVVERGELVAVTGPSGSGKSTLLACLAGLDEPDGGTVWLAGVPLSRRPEPERAARRAQSIGMLFQSNNQLDHLSVAANVRLARRLAPRTSTSARTTADSDLLDELGLGHRRTAFPSQLSGGEAARAGLAVALANDPAVLLADEPTGELDTESASNVLDLLRRRTERGAAAVVVTHAAAVTARADRVIHLADGQIAP